MSGSCQPYRDTLALYKMILRNLRLLPRSQQGYYHDFAKQSILNEQYETDKDRLQMLITRGKNDTLWVLKKFGVAQKAKGLTL